MAGDFEIAEDNYSSAHLILYPIVELVDVPITPLEVPHCSVFVYMCLFYLFIYSFIYLFMYVCMYLFIN